MPGFYYQDGANLRTMSQVYYQDGANLRTITEAWYQDGANMRKIWPPGAAGTVSLSDTYNVDYRNDGDPTQPFAGMSFFSNGQRSTETSTTGVTYISGEWGVGVTGADWEIMVTVSSGTFAGGSSATNTWLSLGSDRSWQVTAPAPFTLRECSGTVQIRAAGGSVVASQSFICTASWGEPG